MGNEEKLAALRAMYADMAAKDFDHFVDSDSCESPIEQLLLGAFLARGARWHTSDHWRDRWQEMGACPGAEFTVMNFLGVLGCQVWVKVQQRDYRVDFALLSVEGPPVAIECDGHDFHEKTKAQVERDKSRERALTQAGWRVVRFAGSEIWRDPIACVDGVVAIVEGLWGKT